ncbi:MAG TPA: cation:proton antiporter, partial [Thermaerobacter sp.]
MEHVVFEIGLALAIMALAGFVATRLRLPTVPLLILVGMAVGPHAPQFGILDFRFLNSAPLIQFMGRIGVLFLLFYLGLEFSLSRLIKAGRSILVGGTIYICLNFTLSLLFGWLMGWPFKETLAAAGIMTITSTAIVAKVLVDLKRTANPETEMILGMIMFDDVFLAVYLAVFSGLVLSGATSLGDVLLSGGTAIGFIVAVLVLGRLARAWLNRLLDISSPEVFLLAVFTALFLLAGFGETVHVAEAVCALLLGLVLADTEHRKRIEHLIVPFRDFFGSVFFFSFGLSLDPRTLGGAVVPALIAVLVTLVGNFVAGMLAGRTAGLSPKAATNIGVTITARGELSIVVANVARMGGLAPV